jgi:hypothetical protein
MSGFTFSAGDGTGGITPPAGSASPWYNVADLVAPVSFTLTGTFVATIVQDYSNNDSASKGDDFTIDATVYTSKEGPRQFTPGASKYTRFRCTAYTSGAPKVSWAKGRGASGAPVEIMDQSSKTPAPSSAGA